MSEIIYFRFICFIFVEKRIMRIQLLLLFLFSSVIAKAQLFGLIPINSYKEGYFYKLNHQKVDARIDIKASSRSLVYSDIFILYKINNSEPVKVLLDSIESIVIGIDSFTVVRHPLLTYYKVEFDGASKIYSTYEYKTISTYNGGTANTKSTIYMYGPNPDSVKSLTRKNFIEVMSQMMADEPLIVTSIKDKTYRYGSIRDLIHLYEITKKSEAITSH